MSKVSRLKKQKAQMEELRHQAEIKEHVCEKQLVDNMTEFFNLIKNRTTEFYIGDTSVDIYYSSADDTYCMDTDFDYDEANTECKGLNQYNDGSGVYVCCYSEIPRVELHKWIRSKIDKGIVYVVKK